MRFALPNSEIIFRAKVSLVPEPSASAVGGVQVQVAVRALRNSLAVLAQTGLRSRPLYKSLFRPHAALKTDSIDHVYNINSLFLCIFALPESEIIFCAKLLELHYVASN